MINRCLCSVFDRRIDNWPYIQKAAKQYLNIDCELHLSGDGHCSDYVYSNIDQDELPPQLELTTSYPTWMTTRSYNAYKSHASLLQKCLDDPLCEIGCMLEDDIVFADDFTSIWNEVYDWIHNNVWDVIFLGGYHHSNSLLRLTDHIYQTWHTGGTHGWIFKRHIIPQILAYGPIGPIDGILSERLEQDLLCYMVYPSIINQQSGYSYLEQGVLQKPSRYHLGC